MPSRKGRACVLHDGDRCPGMYVRGSVSRLPGGREVSGLPLQERAVDAHAFALAPLEVFFQNFGSGRHHMLAFPILEQVQALQCKDDILRQDPSFPACLFDGDVSFVTVHDLQQHPGPVALVADQSEVGERPFWRSKLVLSSAEFVREGDEELPVPFPLKSRQCEDAG
eukprot:scaffold826_cov335-Pavlova_lutheri.AAC.14